MNGTHPIPLSFRQVAIRGSLGRCPCCGKGRLFASYLKQVESCADCGEALGHIRADDGPAWFTLLIVGHIFAMVMLGDMHAVTLPNWLVLTLLVSMTLVLMLAILPRAKGMFIGILWRLNHAPASANDQ